MPVKQVIVMRADLGMRRGKQCAQAGHASGAWLVSQLADGNVTAMAGQHTVQIMTEQAAWLAAGMRKITVHVDSEAELLDVHHAARAAGLVSHLVTDAGHTEFHGVPTVTCCAIGPDYDELIDPITGHLPLY